MTYFCTAISTVENSVSSIEESGEYSCNSAEPPVEVAPPTINSSEKTGQCQISSKQQPTYINPQGVRFTTGEEEDTEGGKCHASVTHTD